MRAKQETAERDQQPAPPSESTSAIPSEPRSRIEWAMCLSDGKLKYCGIRRAWPDPEAASATRPLGRDQHGEAAAPEEGLTNAHAVAFTTAVADRSGSADPSLFAAMLAAHAAIARYLSAQTDVGAALTTRHMRIKTTRLVGDARREVSNMVHILRRRGAGPEYILVRVKELLATLPRSGATAFDSVRQQVIGWAIEEYCHGVEATDVVPETP